jgi:acetylornithine/N-succinyldiaminopimelate aminotransferase
MISPVLPSYARAKLSFVKGEGSWLVEADGRRFLDFGSGIAVMALGHGHPALVKALKDQADRLWHTSNLYTVPEQEALAERLVEHTFADTVFFCNSGTEAAELAIKMARKYRYESDAPERTTILTFEGAFHGRSMAAISAAGAEKLVKGFGPLLPGFRQLPFGDHDALRAAAAEPDVGAIMVEPVQGESGIRPLPDQCLKGLRDLCDEHGLLLILDEIQCGMGRTGRSSPMNGPGSRPTSCWSPRASAAATPSARFWRPRRPRAA